MAGKADKDEEKDDDIVVVEEPDTVVDAGEIDSTAEGEKEEKKVVQKKTPVKKRGNDQQKRLNELWLGKREAETEANRQAGIAAQERNKNTQYEQITASALEDSLNAKRELLTEKLANAKDQPEVAKLTAELTKVEAQSAQIERYKIENKVNPQQKEQQPQQRQQVQEQVSPDEIYDRMSPSGKKWLDENSDWYDDNGENHDPEKSGDVKYYANTLEQELINKGRGAEIGTKAYFNKINDYIKQNWSDDMQDEADDEDEQPAAPQKKNYAAPVGNRSAQSPSSGARKEYKISQSEKEMALSLDMKDTKGNSLSDNEKIKRFIGLRENTPSDGPISMKTMKKGS